jgi:phosphatidylinositol alpha-1,6-mannosyltransferase
MLARSVEVVHALDGWPLGVYGWGAVIGSKKRFFINGVGTYSVAPLYAWGKRWLMLRAYRRAQHIFCISTYTMDQMARVGVPATAMLVVHFGTPMLPVPHTEEVQAYREKYGLIPNQYPIILTVGAIKDRKGQFETLRAVALLKKQYPDILYIVAGGIDQPSYLQKMETYTKDHSLAGNVLFITDADDRSIAFLYSLSSVFALNSNTEMAHHHFEGFGAVITEAYQFGVPAVGSSDSGIEDAIQDGKTGYLTRQGDPEDIARKIEEVLQNRPMLSERARHFAAEFTWKRTVEMYIQYYRDN